MFREPPHTPYHFPGAKVDIKGPTVANVQTPNGLIISVFDRESSHKWLGCMLTTSTVQTTTCDVECRLRAAAAAVKTFNASKWILCDPKDSISQKIEYFDRVFSPIACLAAGHRTVYRNDLNKMDVAYRRLLRSMVGPPRNMYWTLPWHEILDICNERVRAFTLQAASKSWSELCLRHHWNAAQYFATLPRWIRRVLAWHPAGHKRSPPEILWGYYANNLLSVERSGFMGNGCYGSRLLEFVAARFFSIQFAQREMIATYGVRITFAPFAPVPETGCPMSHAGLTLTLTLTLTFLL